MAGKIFVFTGLLSVANTPSALAAVLGHEIAHQIARHSAERASLTKVAFGVDLGLQLLGLDMGLSRLLSTFLLCGSFQILQS